jgi:hypothetical protein
MRLNTGTVPEAFPNGTRIAKVNSAPKEGDREAGDCAITVD